MVIGIIVVVVIVVIVVFLGIWIISAKNRIMTEEQNVFTELNNAKLVVDRRFKNIEATANLMKSHNVQITSAYEKVVAMRSGANQSNPEDYAAIDKELQNVAKSININVERYPELGKLFDVDKFQVSMAQHDRDVESAKKLYNHEVEQFNTLILTIPYSLVAKNKSQHVYWEVVDSQVKDDYIPTFD